jgi:hypothetical protein
LPRCSSSHVPADNAVVDHHLFATAPDLIRHHQKPPRPRQPRSFVANSSVQKQLPFELMTEIFASMSGRFSCHSPATIPIVAIASFIGASRTTAAFRDKWATRLNPSWEITILWVCI